MRRRRRTIKGRYQVQKILEGVIKETASSIHSASRSSQCCSSTGRSPRSAKVGSHAKGTVPEANEINFGMQDASWLAQTSFSALARKENMLQIREICRGEKWRTVLAPFSERFLQLLTHITYAHTAKHATQSVGCTGEKGPHQKLSFLRRTGCCRSGKPAGPRNGCLAYFDRSSLFQRKVSLVSNAQNLCADHRARDSECGVHWRKGPPSKAVISEEDWLLHKSKWCERQQYNKLEHRQVSTLSESWAPCQRNRP